MSWTFYNSSGEALVQHAESEAVKAELEAETSVAKFVPPDMVRHHPGVAKIWAQYDQTDSPQSLTNEYGVDTISDGGGAGDTDLTWDVAFATEANAFAWFTNEGEMTMGCDDTTSSAGLTKIQTMNGSSASDQVLNRIIGFGAHP